MVSVACPICYSPLGGQSTLNIANKGSDINCPRCGRYFIFAEAERHLELEPSDVQSPRVANMSAWIRMNKGKSIDSDLIGRLYELPTPTPAAKAVSLLSLLASKFPSAGQDFVPLIDSDLQQLLTAIRENEVNALPDKITDKLPEILELCGLCSIATREEYDFILRDILTSEMKWITWPATTHIRISPKGWEFLESLKRLNPDSETVFVAMWLDPKMDVVYDEAIEKGILDTGYKPILITKTGHTNRIDDEIFIEINRSRFVVSDYTGQRPSVYYESGYAKALGLTVFWLCDKKARKKLHFDVDHYSFIFYDRDDLVGLRNELNNWILANFPRGAYAADK